MTTPDKTAILGDLLNACRNYAYARTDTDALQALADLRLRATQAEYAHKRSIIFDPGEPLYSDSDL